MYRSVVRITDTAAFQLGTVGVIVAQRFADRIAKLDLKPKHVGVLDLVAATPGASQLDIAGAMGVVPSLVVRLVDHLERLGAVERVRASDDRRRQTLHLTERGHALLTECTAISRSLDADLLAGLGTAERTALQAALREVAANLESLR